ncbi:MAG: chloride channel protein [Bryobacteraceae bacterium]
MRQRIAAWWGRIRQNEAQLSLALSLVIGAVVGLVVVAFIVLTGRLAVRMYPPGGAPWRRVLVPTLGSLVTGFLLFRYFPFARGSGIPQTKYALFVEEGRITLRTVIGKFVCCCTALASGVSLGREGPSVQVGAGIASVISRRLGVSRSLVKSQLVAGSAAALAAAFNTPIAAVLFALEEITGDLHAPVLGSVVVASATAWMVLHLFLGDQPLFHVSGYQLVHPVEFALYAGLGVVGGLASVAFVKLLLWLRLKFRLWPKWTVWFQPAVGGLTTGLIGWFYPEVMGAGYHYIDGVLNGDVVVKVLFILAALKIIATAVCYSSGNAGGIFGPSLFIGAMVGGAFGGVAHHLFPAYTAGPGAYALVGMGVAFAGIVRTPLTSVIMIFEMTRDYTIIVPLMISNLIAFFISYKLQPEPIYEALAGQDGVHLPTAEARAQLLRLRVSDAMTEPGLIFPPYTPIADAMKQGGPIVVGDEHGLWGILDPAQMENVFLESGTLADLFHGARPQDEEMPHLHTDHSLAIALDRMGSSKRRVLPVVSRADVHHLVGLVTLDAVLNAYGLSPSVGASPLP